MGLRRRERRDPFLAALLRGRRVRWGAGSLAVALLVAVVAMWPDGTQVLDAAGPVDATTTTRRATPTAQDTTSSTRTTSTTASPLPTAPPGTAPPTTGPPVTTAPADAIPAPTPPPPPSTAPRPPACAPAPLPAPPRWGPDPSRYDPATVQSTPDPPGPGCNRTKVLVVGDSIGRGAANALRRQARPDLEVWDRTEHGCGLVAPRSGCAGWSAVWKPAIDTIDPDVVLVYLGVSGDVVPGQDPPFHSPEASTLRRAVVDRAITVLSARGAEVVWALPAVPLPNAEFFCGGSIAGTPCDRTWTDRWHRDLRAVAAARGVRTIDLRTWVDVERRSSQADRPDGLHLTGPALDAQAPWLLSQMRDLLG